MEKFSQSVRTVLVNAGKAFGNYPVVLASAFIYVLASLFDISLGYGREQDGYKLLITSIQLATALSAMFGLAAITWARTRKGTGTAFRNANLLAGGVGVLTFILLYFFSGVTPDYYYSQPLNYLVVHPVAEYRVGAAILISSLSFILFAAHPDEEEDFSRSLIMTIKAFFQGLLFGLVMALGALAVAGAVNALILDLPNTINGYIMVLSGFLGFTIFIGFFPDFRRDKEDPRLESARTKPHFLSVLLDYILVPIMLAFTLVLLIWAALTIFRGMDTDFMMLFSISAGYAAAGLILHILVTHSETGMAKFYLKVFPLAVLPILVFEAWALFLQIQRFGLRTTEYLFILGWIVTFIAALLLIVKQQKGHPAIVHVISIAAVIGVLPFLGLGDLPVMTQLNRLERLLTNENMLQAGRIVPAKELPALDVRQDISNTVEFLVYVPHATYPDWLDKNAMQKGRFESIMGFESTVTGSMSNGFQDVMLAMPSQAVDVTGYEWSIFTSDTGKGYMDETDFTGTRGIYNLQWDNDQDQGVPIMKLSLNGEVILEENFQGFLEGIKTKYLLGTGEVETQKEDLIWHSDNDTVEVVFVLRQLQISGSSEDPYYYLDIATILFKEK